MKRIISLILTVLLLMTSINTVVFAGSSTELTIDATEPYNNVAGEGYFDEGSYTYKGFELLMGGACLRFGDWVAYEVSSLAAGRYKMSVNYLSRRAIPFSVYVDDVLKLEASVNSNATVWSDPFSDAELGIIELSGTQ